MRWAAILLLLVYAALKAARLAFITGTGFDRRPISFGQRLRSGEPVLFVLAVLLSVPPALGATWYHKRKFTAILQNSTACYGRIGAFKDVPGIARTNGESAIYDAFERHREQALDAARQLDASMVAAERELDAAAAAFEAEQSAPRNSRSWQNQIAATQRCLRPPIEVQNA